MAVSTKPVLHALLADSGREQYGLERSRSTGVAHGKMYGIPVRFEDQGWLKNRLDYPADRATPRAATAALPAMVHSEVRGLGDNSL